MKQKIYTTKMKAVFTITRIVSDYFRLYPIKNEYVADYE